MTSNVPCTASAATRSTWHSGWPRLSWSGRKSEMDVPCDQLTLPTPTNSGATISSCGRFRYKLWRRWDDGPMALFVMLNPSTADATQDDPTIRRCIGFAKRWEMGGIRVCNLYALRTTDPRGLVGVVDAVGEHGGMINRNDSAILSAAGDAGRIIAAWGAWPGPYSMRTTVVQHLLRRYRVEALGFTKSGAPRHPLYMRADAEPVTYWPGALAA